MCFDDCERPTVQNKSRPRAKKPHVCCECDSRIEPGERHECFSGLWEGEWTTYRTCWACLKDRGRIVAREVASGCALYEATPPFRGVREALSNYGMTPTRK